ncbi:hypothetical protein GIB67_036649 [Kingdonia uniflora]|uniref:non-specific serine/threonine protein kinase n=1 Tax=Kingdonia uniflora TaxID=39325 RepID=A0A7J7LWM2_9MAGN|nr:hypothetical protein GIB67_036649 [Kingdonia uniflora]
MKKKMMELILANRNKGVIGVAPGYGELVSAFDSNRLPWRIGDYKSDERSSKQNLPGGDHSNIGVIMPYVKFNPSDKDAEPFVEVDSKRRYGRYNDLLGVGAVKKILRGLEYLHTHEPCIIHRDLKLNNIFINGNTGRVKIGDFGLSAVVDSIHVAHTVLGTPEFVAPELYEKNYTELVDIYAFGLCVLELVTREIPYSECDTNAKTYKKVISGVRPQAMNKVKDPEVTKFIEKCLAKPKERPFAAELLKDPFFDGLDDGA